MEVPGMERFEFDAVDEPTMGERAPLPGPDDTQALRVRRCDVCCLPQFFGEHELPPDVCPGCDERLTRLVTGLIRGRGIADLWSMAIG